MTKRPEWDFTLTEKQVSDLNQNIVKITHHSALTGVDTAKNWVEFHTDNGKFKPTTYWTTYFEFSPNHRSLLSPNWRGQQALERLHEIQIWEREHQNDLDELKRLKNKLGLT